MSTNALLGFLYRWLPIVFGCHCRSDRSFHWHGRQFPLCARCTGELLGILLAMVVCLFFRCPVKLCVVLMVPMVLDGSIQLLSPYESQNVLRCVTGMLFGFGFWMLFVHSVVFVLTWSYQMGLQWGAAMYSL